LFDALVATFAKKYNADAIFSFDEWYKNLGFKLVTSLV
jgi:predicted nucleic acid-binding protein